MKYKYNIGLRRNRKAIAVVSTLVIVTLIAGIISFQTITAGPIPKDIQNKINFSIYLPEEGKDVITKDSIAFNTEEGVLTYGIMYIGEKILISQQAEPEAFSDGPVYQHLLNKMKQYDEVKTNIGNVTLTKPEELKGGQTAVANSNGSLLFARPSKDLTREQWQQFFNTLRISR